jgi:Domain of unknown function (DUF4397)
MRKIVLFTAAILITSLYLTSCSKKSSGPSNTANVMFMNAYIDNSSEAVTVNSNPVSGASSLAYLQNTGYVGINASNSEVLSFANSFNGITTTATTSFSANTYYSVFLTGLGSPSIYVTTDNFTAPGSGQAAIRFVDLSPNAAATFKIYTGTSTTPTDSTLGYLQNTAFTNVTASSSYHISATSNLHPAYSKDTVINVGSGKVYTIVITGIDTSNISTTALGLKVVNNN